MVLGEKMSTEREFPVDDRPCHAILALPELVDLQRHDESIQPSLILGLGYKRRRHLTHTLHSMASTPQLPLPTPAELEQLLLLVGDAKTTSYFAGVSVCRPTNHCRLSDESHH